MATWCSVQYITAVTSLCMSIKCDIKYKLGKHKNLSNLFFKTKNTGIFYLDFGSLLWNLCRVSPYLDVHAALLRLGEGLALEDAEGIVGEIELIIEGEEAVQQLFQGEVMSVLCRVVTVQSSDEGQIPQEGAVEVFFAHTLVLGSCWDGRGRPNMNLKSKGMREWRRVMSR